ncbi:sugar-binding domain-containing protein [uncultured Chitinophaga sp.]|uniref:sugar-binding domain-containing protein n=1 Tax=uncultured Chitinophaga sp. TaxID=339340 RepID=UPI0025F50740|nr:sugar-binding domain-containing protein [uncultured Chitinophaga sp.]
MIRAIVGITTWMTLCLSYPLAVSSQAVQRSQLISDDWKFFLGDAEGAEKPAFKDDNWKKLDLPHDWSVDQPYNPSLASAAGYLPGGIGWYRKSIVIGPGYKDKKVSIYFEGVSNNSEVFINGKSLGRRPNGYISFSYDLTPYLKEGETNVLAVRVDRTKYNDSRWYAGSGISRNVYLQATNPVHLQQWGTNYYTRSVGKDGASLTISSTLENNASQPANVSLQQRILDKTTQKVLATATKTVKLAAGEKLEVSVPLKVPGAKAWSVASPTLYTLQTSIMRGKEVLDEEHAPVGFRTIRFDPDNGFALNGEWMKLKGVCLHHDAGVLGAAVPRAVWERRLKTLKTLGCNAVRTSHNPANPDLYDLCDELGLLVMDEGFDEWKHPKRKWVEGWNVGKPGFDGYAPNFEEWGSRDMGDLVLRDRRHPSIIMWSIGNEVDYPNDPYSHPVLDTATFGQKAYGGYRKDAPDAMELGVIAQQLTKVVKTYDTTRPVTAALAGVIMSNYTGYPGALDVAGYNYTENRYAMDHKSYPKRILYGSENRHDMAAWKAVRDSKNIFGQFLWTGIDYLGESGPWPSRGFYSGLMDFAGFVKPLGYYRRALWAEQPVIYVGAVARGRGGRGQLTNAPAIWNFEVGDTVRVVAYTNAPQAKLLLNNKEVGAARPYDDATGVIYWDIPYQPGKLEAVALNNGSPVANMSIQTSGRPYRLLATIEGNASNLAQVIVTVVDEENRPVLLADNNITCTIDGPARLLGLEAGDNTDMGDYTDNKQRAYMGRLLAYLQPTRKGGPAKITFSSPLLQPVTVTLAGQ